MEGVQAGMNSYKCVQCGAEVTVGDIRSGVISFGAFFVEYSPQQKTRLGAPLLDSGLQKNNRVVSYACTNCGYISSYLGGCPRTD